MNEIEKIETIEAWKGSGVLCRIINFLQLVIVNKKLFLTPIIIFFYGFIRFHQIIACLYNETEYASIKLITYIERAVKIRT